MDDPLSTCRNLYDGTVLDKSTKNSPVSVREVMGALKALEEGAKEKGREELRKRKFNVLQYGIG